MLADNNMIDITCEIVNVVFNVRGLSNIRLVISERTIIEPWTGLVVEARDETFVRNTARSRQRDNSFH
jgi:hypothetical protein